jgi:UDP-GlcNAc:undecaprenyl-phosphate GlcNAc-1-phosphate transferase
MLPLVLIFILAFLINLAVTPLARSFARLVGLVDRPDGRRKLQANPIPVAGGLAVFLSVVIAIGLAMATTEATGVEVTFNTEVLLELLAGSVIICAVGVIDDAVGLRGRYKLLGQCLAVGMVIACGVQVHRVSLFHYEFELGMLSIPLTMFLLLGAINSLNLMDGMDGLLGSLGLIVCVTFGAMAVACGQIAAAWVAVAMGGALLAFLRYNFPPATIYLGDGGSMLVGLVVGVLAIQGSLKGPATVALIAPACVLIVPIFDTAAAITRRKLIGRSIFSTDRGHLHHCLLRSGLSRPRALMVVIAISIVAMAGGMVSIMYRSEAASIVAAGCIVVTLTVTRLFGYNEARLILKRLRHLSFFSLHSPARDGAAVLAINFQGTIDWEPVWRILLGCSERLKFRQVRLDIEDPAIGESFHARLDRGTSLTAVEASRELKIVFPLETGGRLIGRVEVTGDRAKTALSDVVGQLTGVVQEMERLAADLVATVYRPSEVAAPNPPSYLPELEPALGVAADGRLV